MGKEIFLLSMLLSLASVHAKCPLYNRTSITAGYWGAVR
jgi:hypothetical protein